MPRGRVLKVCSRTPMAHCQKMSKKGPGSPRILGGSLTPLDFPVRSDEGFVPAGISFLDSSS